jgi:hypothetical protein
VPEWRDVLEVLGGFLAGFSVKWFFVWRSNRTTIQQKGNIVGGSLAGRDVTVNRDTKK